MGEEEYEDVEMEKTKRNRGQEAGLKVNQSMKRYSS